MSQRKPVVLRRLEKQWQAGKRGLRPFFSLFWKITWLKSLDCERLMLGRFELGYWRNGGRYGHRRRCQPGFSSRQPSSSEPRWQGFPPSRRRPVQPPPARQWAALPTRNDRIMANYLRLLRAQEGDRQHMVKRIIMTKHQIISKSGILSSQI